MGALEIASAVFLSLGLFFALTGAVGVWRMPDFFSRIHPAGKAESFAQILIVIGLALRADDILIVAKLGMLSILLFITSPTATHAITKAARLDGLLPWVKPDDQEALASRELQVTAPGHQALPPAAETIVLYSKLHALDSHIESPDSEGDNRSPEDSGDE